MLWKAEPVGRSAHIDDSPWYIQLQRIIRRIKNMYTHITQGTTTVIYQFSPRAGVVYSLFVRWFRRSSRPQIPLQFFRNRILTFWRQTVVSMVFRRPGMYSMYFTDDTRLDQKGGQFVVIKRVYLNTHLSN